jgi:hypothetical protein
MYVTSEQEAIYKATNCAVKISHSLARPDTDQEGQSMEDNPLSYIGKNTEAEGPETAGLTNEVADV